MVWRSHPGEVVLVSELSVINLRARDGEMPSAHLSVYDVRYAPGRSPGSVAFLRHYASPDDALSTGLVLTDSASAATCVIDRLRSARWGVVPLDREPRRATFKRTVDAESVTLQISSADIEVLAEWRGLFGPVWGDGQSNNYPNHHQWAFVLEASDARLALNGVPVDGEIYPDERFRLMFGAPISSAQIGLAEVSVELG